MKLKIKLQIYIITFVLLVTCSSKAFAAPTLSTQSASDINATYVTANGTLDDTGGATIAQHGFVWNTTGVNPTLSPPAVTHLLMNDNAANTTVTNSEGSYAGASARNTSLLTTVGKINNAFNFNGTSDYVGMSSGYADFTGGLTFSVWAYPTAVKSYARFFDFGNGSPSENIMFYRSGTSNDLGFTVYKGTTAQTEIKATGAIALNQWQHFVVTLASTGAATIYKNGAVVASGTTGIPNNIARTKNYIGRSNWSSDAYYQGTMDDARVFNRALTSNEVAVLYNSGNGTEEIGGDAGSQSNQLGSMSGTASFSAPLDGLTPNTTYYVRSYVTDSTGVTTYGNVVSFTTSNSGYATWTGTTSTAWNVGTNWSTGSVPDSNTEVVIDGNGTNAPTLDLSGGAVTIKALSIGATNSSTLTVSNGDMSTKQLITSADIYVGPLGTITHTANTTTQTHSLNIQAANIFIAGGGFINADYRGYQHAAGTGKGGNGYGSGGGGYGGSGGVGEGAAGGSTYGSLTQPNELGSGGGDNGTSYLGGAGGGAIKLTVTGTSSISGSITANGQNYTNVRVAGGSGGSIWLSTGTLSGSGTISANGGKGHNWGAGGGAGGRIAVYYTTDSSSGMNFQAYGALRDTFTDRMGGAGTIFKKQLGVQTNGDLIIDNSDQDSLDDRYIGRTPLNATFTFDNLTLQNYGNLETGSSSNITYSTLDWSTKGIITDKGGTFAVVSGGGDLTIPATARVYETIPARTFTSLTINGGLVMSNYDMSTNKLVVSGDVSIGSAGLLTHNYNATTQAHVINIEAANLYLASGGQIDVSYRGFQHSEGTGQGGNGNTAGGGGYGGAGGNGTTGAGGIVYDNDVPPNQPDSLGSGGGDNASYLGGAGGGAVKIVVSGEASISGTIYANGANSPASNYAGGGSGGAIWITAATLSGASGILSANGGNASTSSRGGGGGGGRIALIFSTNEATFSALSVSYGTGVNNGSVGTIYPDLYPSISNQSVTDISDVSAIGHGSVDSIGIYGITEHGHVWSSASQNPTLWTPISHWKMNDNAANTIVADAIGGNPGTAPRNTSLMTTAGKINSALLFNGTSDIATIGTSNRPTNTFSFGGWIKTSVTHQIDTESTSGTGGTSGQRYAFGATNMATNGGAGLSVGTNGISVYEHGNSYLPATAVYAADIGSGWNHIMIVYNNKQPTIYLNGVAVHTGLTSPKATVYAPIQFGGGQYGYLTGPMDDIRIYDTALTQDEISAIYNSGNGTEDAYAGLLFTTKLGTKTNAGAFTSNLTSLLPSTTYYIRAYSIISDASVIYSAAGSFTTLAPMDHFEVTGNASQTAGSSQNITITAKTAAGDNFTAYNGDHNVTFSGANNAPDGTHPTCQDKNSNDINFGTGTTLNFVDGVATCSMKLYKAEAAEIETTDGTYNTSGSATYDLNSNVSPAATNAGHSSIDVLPTPASVNNQVAITATTFDVYDNMRTSGGDTVTVAVAGDNPGNPSTTDNTDGTYTAQYIPSVAGEDQITGTINSSAIGKDTEGTSDGTFHLTVINDTPTMSFAITDFTVNIGALDPNTDKSSTQSFSVATNASSGYVVQIFGDTLSNGVQTIDALSTASTSLPGTKQFGMNLVANSSPSVGSDPSGGNGEAAPGYDSSDYFKYVSGDTIAQASSSSDSTFYTMSFIGNIATNTESGSYSTNLNLVTTGRF